MRQTKLWMFAAILIILCGANAFTSYRTATFMLVADDDMRAHANLAEGAKREAKWRENGHTVISMKNDFKTIYGPEVTKVAFTFPEN